MEELPQPLVLLKNETSPSSSTTLIPNSTSIEMKQENRDSDRGTSIGPGMNYTNKLIDFAIAGFPKCGTTFLRKSLLKTDQFFFGNDDAEVHLLRQNKVKDFIDLFEGVQKSDRSHHAKNKTSIDAEGVEGANKEDDPSTVIKRGFKCPDLLYSHVALTNIEKYFPSTDLIVSVRHPVLWFQSFYNYRLRHGYHMPHPNHLIGACPAQDMEVALDPWERRRVRYAAHKVCTDNSRFHFALSRLGKTSMKSKDEMQFFYRHRSEQDKSRVATMKMSRNYQYSNRIFLMELGQLSVENRTRADEFVQDLELFLGLGNAERPDKGNNAESEERNVDEKYQAKKAEKHNHLPKLKRHNPPHRIKGDVDKADIQNNLIDICSRQYDSLRLELVQIGRDASTWIQRYFMVSKDVVVSDEQHLSHLLDLWKVDPCESK